MRKVVFPFLAGVLAAPAFTQQPTSSPAGEPNSPCETVYPIECDESDCDELDADASEPIDCDEAETDELAIAVDSAPRLVAIERLDPVPVEPAAESALDVVESTPTPTEAVSVDETAAGEPAEDACAFGCTGDWGGARKDLEEKGISFGASLIFDLHQVASGGVDRDTIGHTLFDFTATFDLAKLAGLPDAVVVADAYVVNGRNPSDSVGDFQSFSNISAGHVAQLGQLYYEQYLFEQKLRVKLGKADSNADFGAPDSSGEFIHSASAFSPTTFSMATYPNPATCVAAFWQPNESWYAAGGVYDGATNAGINTGGHGVSTFFGSPSDLFLICEAGHRWTAGKDDLAGRFTLGAWKHTGDFDRFAGGSSDGTAGWYALADQELARLGGDEGGTLAAFVQWGSADEDVSDVNQHFGAGLACNGCCGRADDSLGIYVSNVGFSEGAGTSADSETAFEAYYKWQAQPWFVVKPDVQFITNPGGDAALEDAFVLTLRMQIDF